jgi:hypothetical protein
MERVDRGVVLPARVVTFSEWKKRGGIPRGSAGAKGVVGVGLDRKIAKRKPNNRSIEKGNNP